MENLQQRATGYPGFANGVPASEYGPDEVREFLAANPDYRVCENGSIYCRGYAPVRGGWGYAGNNGVGYGPCREPVGGG